MKKRLLKKIDPNSRTSIRKWNKRKKKIMAELLRNAKTNEQLALLAYAQDAFLGFPINFK